MDGSYIFGVTNSFVSFDIIRSVYSSIFDNNIVVVHIKFLYGVGMSDKWQRMITFKLFIVLYGQPKRTDGWYKYLDNHKIRKFSDLLCCYFIDICSLILQLFEQGRS